MVLVVAVAPPTQIHFFQPGQTSMSRQVYISCARYWAHHEDYLVKNVTDTVNVVLNKTTSYIHFSQSKLVLMVMI